MSVQRQSNYDLRVKRPFIAEPRFSIITHQKKQQAESVTPIIHNQSIEGVTDKNSFLFKDQTGNDYKLSFVYQPGQNTKELQAATFIADNQVVFQDDGLSFNQQDLSQVQEYKGPKIEFSTLYNNQIVLPQIKTVAEKFSDGTLNSKRFGDLNSTPKGNQSQYNDFGEKKTLKKVLVFEKRMGNSNTSNSHSQRKKPSYGDKMLINEDLDTSQANVTREQYISSIYNNLAVNGRKQAIEIPQQTFHQGKDIDLAIYEKKAKKVSKTLTRRSPKLTVRAIEDEPKEQLLPIANQPYSKNTSIKVSQEWQGMPDGLKEPAFTINPTVQHSYQVSRVQMYSKQFLNSNILEAQRKDAQQNQNGNNIESTYGLSYQQSPKLQYRKRKRDYSNFSSNNHNFKLVTTQQYQTLQTKNEDSQVHRPMGFAQAIKSMSQAKQQEVALTNLDVFETIQQQLRNNQLQMSSSNQMAQPNLSMVKSMSQQDIEGLNFNRGINVNSSKHIGDEIPEKLPNVKYNEVCRKLYNANELFELAQMIKKQKLREQQQQSQEVYQVQQNKLPEQQLLGALNIVKIKKQMQPQNDLFKMKKKDVQLIVKYSKKSQNLLNSFDEYVKGGSIVQSSRNYNQGLLQNHPSHNQSQNKLQLKDRDQTKEESKSSQQVYQNTLTGNYYLANQSLDFRLIKQSKAQDNTSTDLYNIMEGTSVEDSSIQKNLDGFKIQSQDTPAKKKNYSQQKAIVTKIKFLPQIKKQATLTLNEIDRILNGIDDTLNQKKIKYKVEETRIDILRQK